MRFTWLKSQNVSQYTCERCFKTLEKVSPSFQLSVETRFPKKWAPRARLKNIDYQSWNALTVTAVTLTQTSLSSISLWIWFDFFLFLAVKVSDWPRGHDSFHRWGQATKVLFLCLDHLPQRYSCTTLLQWLAVKGIWMFTSFFKKKSPFSITFFSYCGFVPSFPHAL